MLRSLVAFTSLLLPVTALASGSTGPRALQTIHVEGNSFVMVTGTSTFLNPDSCGNPDGVMIRASDPWYKDSLAAVMMAKASGLPVQFWVSGCATTSWGYTLPIVYSVTVDP